MRRQQPWKIEWRYVEAKPPADPLVELLSVGLDRLLRPKTSVDYGNQLRLNETDHDEAEDR